MGRETGTRIASPAGVVFGAALLVAAFTLAGCSRVPRPQLDAPPEERLRYGWELLERGRTFNAKQAFEDLIFSAPGSAIIDSAHYGLAEANFAEKNWVQAGSEYATIVTSFPRSGLVDDAAFKVGLCWWHQSLSYKLDQTETVRALDAFRAFIQDYPTSDRLDEALEYIFVSQDKLALKAIYQAETYLKLATKSDFQAAAIYFSEAILTYPDTRHMPRALWGLGMAWYRSGDRQNAIDTFGALVSNYPDSRYVEKAQERLQELRPPPRS